MWTMSRVRLPRCYVGTTVGLGRDGQKRVLTSAIRFGRENLEDWKTVLRGLIERGPFIAELRKKREHYLAFLKPPSASRARCRDTALRHL